MLHPKYHQVILPALLTWFTGRPLHHSHSHYESPFQQIDMRPGVLQSTTDFFSQQLTAINAWLSRQPLVLTVFLVACAVALLGLALFLFSARRCLRRQRLLQECRRHFDDDDDEGGFAVHEKGGHGPARGDSLPAETHLEFGLNGAGHTEGASFKHNLPFHVSGYL